MMKAYGKFQMYYSKLRANIEKIQEEMVIQIYQRHLLTGILKKILIMMINKLQKAYLMEMETME